MNDQEFLECFLACMRESGAFRRSMFVALQSEMNLSAAREDYECAKRCRDMTNYLKRKFSEKDSDCPGE